MSFILQDVATKQRAEQIRMMDCKRPRYSREIELPTSSIAWIGSRILGRVV